MRLEYTPFEALELIMTALREVNPAVADRAQSAIDAGVDETVEQDIQRGQGRRRQISKREYRKNRPLTDTESIDAVLGVLEAHLIVHRRVVNSVIHEFAEAAIGSVEPPGRYDLKDKQVVYPITDSIGVMKALEIEIVPESARRTEALVQTVSLTLTDENQLTEITEVLSALKTLTRFES